MVYKSKTGAGNDEVLQYKIMGTTETAHVTLHPDGTVNFRTRLTKTHLKHAIETGLVGWKPQPSLKVKQFLSKARNRILCIAVDMLGHRLVPVRYIDMK